MADLDEPLYTPARPDLTRVFDFLRKVNAKYGLQLTSYEELYKWSTTRIDDFWSSVWDETDIIGTKGDQILDASASPADNPVWFADAKLNWAENLLRGRVDKIAIIQACMSACVLQFWRFRERCIISS